MIELELRREPGVFEVGDEVEFAGISSTIPAGAQGIVREVFEECGRILLAVEWPQLPGARLWSCDGRVPSGKGWIVPPQTLKLLD